MPTLRLFRRAAGGVALVGLFVLAASGSPGKPRKEDKKPTRSVNSVKINYLLNDDDTNPYPYALKVDYAAAEDGLEVAINYPGKAVNPQDAPQPGGPLSFTLDFTGDTTGVDVTAVLRSKANPTDIKASDTRYRLTFIGGGMMVDQPFKLEPPKGSKLAPKAGKAGGPIKAGFHHGQFPGHAVTLPPVSYSARMWIQGRFSQGAPRTDYDLPMSLVWLQQGTKWYPCWGKVLTEDLKAGPVKPGSEEPFTVVRVLLLDDRGKVVHIMTYQQ